MLVGLDGRPLSEHSISRGVHRIARRAGVALHTVHQFRHTCASDLIEADVALPEVQRILGHQAIATTVRYTHIADPQRREAMARHRSMTGSHAHAHEEADPHHPNRPRHRLRRVRENCLSDPFGAAVPVESGLDYNLRCPGQYFDSETGTHYNYFRDYDPALGRYQQSDPIGVVIFSVPKYSSGRQTVYARMGGRDPLREHPRFISRGVLAGISDAPLGRVYDV